MQKRHQNHATVAIVCAGLTGGGAEKAAVNLANGLYALGLDVCIINIRRKNIGDPYPITKGIRVIRFESSRNISRILWLVSLLKVENIKVLISFTDVPNVVTYFAKSLVNDKPRHISSIQNNLSTRDSLTRPNLKSKLLHFAHVKSIKHSDAVVAVSRGVASDLVSYYRLNQKIHTIYNGCINKVSCDKMLMKEHDCSSIVKIVASCRLTIQKDPMLLISVASSLKKLAKFRFTIDIYGEGEMREQVLNEIKLKSLTNEVFLKGFDINYLEQLQNYNVFLLTSRYEGLANVLVEALNAGLMVVSSDCPSGPSEVLDHGNFGELVASREPSDYANRIIKMSQGVHRNKIGLKQHLNMYTPEYNANRYFDLI